MDTPEKKPTHPLFTVDSDGEDDAPPDHLASLVPYQNIQQHHQDISTITTGSPLHAKIIAAEKQRLNRQSCLHGGPFTIFSPLSHSYSWRTALTSLIIVGVTEILFLALGGVAYWAGAHDDAHQSDGAPPSLSQQRKDHQRAARDTALIFTLTPLALIFLVLLIHHTIDTPRYMRGYQHFADVLQLATFPNTQTIPLFDRLSTHIDYLLQKRHGEIALAYLIANLQQTWVTTEENQPTYPLPGVAIHEEKKGHPDILSLPSSAETTSHAHTTPDTTDFADSLGAILISQHEVVTAAAQRPLSEIHVAIGSPGLEATLTDHDRRLTALETGTLAATQCNLILDQLEYAAPRFTSDNPQPIEIIQVESLAQRDLQTTRPDDTQRIQRIRQVLQYCKTIRQQLYTHPENFILLLMFTIRHQMSQPGIETSIKQRATFLRTLLNIDNQELLPKDLGALLSLFFGYCLVIDAEKFQAERTHDQQTWQQLSAEHQSIAYNALDHTSAGRIIRNALTNTAEDNTYTHHTP